MAETELTTPKNAFGKPISQCGLSTKPLKPHELTTPEKTPFQRVNRLLYQQTQRAEFQQKKSTQLTQKSPHQRTNRPLKRYQFWIFTTLINCEFKLRYDNLNFEFLPLDLAIWLRFSSCKLTPN
ncbi:hypothetical protein V8068_002773 [Vibrio parahaemolyticus]